MSNIEQGISNIEVTPKVKQKKKLNQETKSECRISHEEYRTRKVLNRVSLAVRSRCAPLGNTYQQIRLLSMRLPQLGNVTALGLMQP
jgi:hypothetical protein